MTEHETPQPADAGPLERTVKPLCSHCGFPLPASGSGLRHYGTHTAHQEYECLRLLQAEIDRLQAEVKRLSEPGTVYMACKDHRHLSYSMDVQIGLAPAFKRECPVCSGKATNVRPANDVPDIPVPF